MKILHSHITAEYNGESRDLFCCLERIQLKMVDFQNHRCFTLRCLDEEVVPVSIKLKSQVKTPKGFQIIRKAEIALLNERIRSINNTISMLSSEFDTCMRRLKEKIKEEDLIRCINFIKESKEARHLKTISRQKDKLKILISKKQETENKSSKRGGHSNNRQSGMYMHSGRYMYSGNFNTGCPNQVLGSKGETEAEDLDRELDKEKEKWVINISNTPLTPDQEKLLAHGPNYAIMPKEPPITQYVAAVENACTKLEEGKAEEFRVQVKSAIQKIKPPRSNLTRGERRAIAELKKDKSRMILTADKGVALVVLKTEDYLKKAEELLNQNTYRALTSDPTMRLKNKMINLLKFIKSKGGITEELYRRLYPIGAGSPKFYGLPKIHKPGMPLRPIVSSIGAVTYHTSKEVARILKPLMGKSIHHVKNTQDFIVSIKGIHLSEDQCMVSYDVKALFTSVPTTKACIIIKQRLEDTELNQRTSLSIDDIISLLEFCITSTYFSFQGKFYEQVEGAAMGSPLSPIVANIYMENFEVEAIRSAPIPPQFWKRYVDDTFTILESSKKEEFLEHLNSIDQQIQFTAEEPREDGAMPFLDILVSPGRDGSLSTSVYRKPTHTDLYLQWESHHPLSSKYSVIGTLQHRANTICSNPQLLHEEEKHLHQALKRCQYPNWALNKVKHKMRNPGTRTTAKRNSNITQRSYIVVPYYAGLSENIKNIGKKFGVQVHCKGGTTIKNLLMAPKDKDPMLKQSGVIYRYHCDRVDCDEEYVGESSRTFGERFKEHLKSPSPIYDHSNISGHKVTINNFEIVGREDLNQMRTIKEAIYIRVNDPSLNRNVGKYHLPHVWDEVLANISELKFK